MDVAGDGEYVSLDVEAWEDFLESRFKRLSVIIDPGSLNPPPSPDEAPAAASADAEKVEGDPASGAAVEQPGEPAAADTTKDEGVNSRREVSFQTSAETKGPGEDAGEAEGSGAQEALGKGDAGEGDLAGRGEERGEMERKEEAGAEAEPSPGVSTEGGEVVAPGGEEGAMEKEAGEGQVREGAEEPPPLGTASQEVQAGGVGPPPAEEAEAGGHRSCAVIVTPAGSAREAALATTTPAVPSAGEQGASTSIAAEMPALQPGLGLMLRGGSSGSLAGAADEVGSPVRSTGGRGFSSPGSMGGDVGAAWSPPEADGGDDDDLGTHRSEGSRRVGSRRSRKMPPGDGAGSGEGGQGGEAEKTRGKELGSEDTGTAGVSGGSTGREKKGRRGREGMISGLFQLPSGFFCCCFERHPGRSSTVAVRVSKRRRDWCGF